MTLVIAEILHDDAGRIAMLADTKLTDAIDEAGTGQIYTRPCLKIVIVNDDIAVGFFGDNPGHCNEVRGPTATRVIAGPGG